jgi:hypothetical protein
LKKTIIAIPIIILLVSMFSLVNASTVESIYVRDDGEIGTITINLQANQKAIGAFNITGAREDIVDFWVRDPEGVIILDSGTIVNGANFTFTANSDGEYTLNFQNNGDYTKYINLEYDIESGFLPNSADVLIWLVLGAVMIVLVLVGIGVYVLFRRNRNKPNTP